MCRRELENIAATSRFSGFSKLSRTSTVHFHVGAIFQVIFHCLHNPFFYRTAADSQAAPTNPMATRKEFTQTIRAESLKYLALSYSNSAAAQAAPFFFLTMGAISLVDFHTSSLLAYWYNNVLAFCEKEKDCGSTNYQSEQKEKTSQSSVTTEEGKQAPQSHQAPHAHAQTNQADNQTRSQASPRGLPKTDHHNSPNLALFIF